MSTLRSQLVSLLATRRQSVSNRRKFASWLRNWFQGPTNFVETSRPVRRLGRRFSSSFEQLEARAMMAVLSELKVNPPGSAAGSDKYQYIELAGAASESLANQYVVMLDGNGSAAGTASYVANLGSRVLGSNGLLMIKSPTGGHAAGLGTTVVTDTQFDNGAGILNKNTVSFVLASANAAFVQGTDYDTNNDGTLDNLPAGFTLFDSVGWNDGDAGDRVYGSVSLTQTQGTPDAATRIVGNTSTASSAWYNADLYDIGNDATQLLFDKDRASSNLPVNPFIASITPGAANFEASTTTRALRMVSYNITSSGNSGIPQTGLSTILQGIGSEIVSAISRPIDLLSIQEILSQATTSVTVAGLLNSAYGSLATYAASVMNGGTTGAGTQGFVYNTQTLSLVGEAVIGTTSVSGQPRQTNRAQFRPAGTTGSSDFYVYNGHWKSADTTADEARRLVEAQAIRTNADALGQGANILYVGDFNVYRGTDDGFQALIVAGNGQAFDPVNRIGSWSGNSSFVDILTQAPAQSPPNGLTGGGLDDRFDFQMISGELLDGQGLEYRTGSYHTFGNNGSVPLDGDINSPSSTALPGLSNRTTILNLLVSVTDHLPVVADFTYTVASTPNQAPSGTDKTVSTNEDTSYTYTTSDFGFSDSSNTLLAVRVATLPTVGSLLLNNAVVSAGQFIPVVDITAGNLKFAPVANANGSPYSTWTFQVQDNGGTANGGVDLDPTSNTITVNVSAVNDAPATSTTGGSAGYAGSAIIVDSGATVSDIDNVNLVGATVIITGNFSSGQDILGFLNANGITGAYNATTGVLTLNGSASVANYQLALRSVTYNNTSANPNTGTRTLSFQINDGSVANNLSNVATKAVTISGTAGLPVVVSSRTPTTTGVEVVFNRPVNASLINLYDQGATLGATDVTLVGANTGVVRGSLVFNSTNTGFTFIKTGLLTAGSGLGAEPGILAPDTYTLTLRSNATNGFVDLAGNALRDASGTVAGDYVSTFTVAASAANALTFSIPDFARGFSQAIKVPNTGAGLPVVLSNGNNVSGVDFRLSYDPTLMTITGFTTTIPGATATVNIGTPGTANVQIYTTTSFANVDGAVVLGNFDATVPESAAYAAKQILRLSNLQAADASVELNSIPTIADHGIHIAAFVGDANGDKAYSSADSTLIARGGVGTNSGFVAYQLADPYVAGDLNSNLGLSSADTTILARQAVGTTQALVPALPSGITPPVANGVDPRLFIPRNLNAVDVDAVAAGIQIDIPVNIEVTETSGITISGFDLAISYDSTKFTIATAGAATIGSLLTPASGNLTGTPLGITYNAATPGIIRLQASTSDGTRTLPFGTTGSIVVLRATIAAGATGTTIINVLANSGGTSTAIADNDVNSLVLVPAPTNANTDAIDGLLTITAVSNGAPTDIGLSPSTIAENAGANATVGALSTVDPDSGDTFTYTLVTGTGSTDNASFNISGSTLRATASLDFETKSSYTVRVRSTDAGTLFFEKAFTITVTNVNETPTDIALAPASIAENAGANATVGTLSTVDPDVGNTFTYTLVTGTGSTDNASFNISGSTLRATASLDFETKSSYTVRVRSTDAGTLFFEKAFTITVTNVNETPTDIALAPASIAENAGANATVGTLSTVDPDVGNTFTYTLVTGTGGTDNASFNISGSTLRATASLDFETKSSYTVRVRSTDAGTLFFEKAFTIAVTNVNEAPVFNPATYTFSVAENSVTGTAVGTVISTDPDTGATRAYSLSGSGSTNFAVNATTGAITVAAGAVLNFEGTNTFSLTASVSDGSLSASAPVTINVTNILEARLSIPKTLTTAVDVDLTTLGVQVDLPVILDVIEGVGTTLSGFDLAIAYDSTRLTIATAGAATIGSLLTPASGNLIGAPLGITYNAATPGIIRLQASTSDGTRTLPFGTTGSIVVLRATVAAGATGTTIINLLANSGGTTTGVADNDVNSPVLVPGATNADTDAVDGLLTINAALPTLVSTVINDGAVFTNANQRSQLVSLTVQFSAPVTLVGATAFTLRNRDTNSFIDPNQIIFTGGTSQSFVITFGNGAGVVPRTGNNSAAANGNSLVDGNYELTVERAKVEGDNVFGENDTDGFFRLYGDSDGDGRVSTLDTAAFRAALSSYNAAFDFDGNGFVTNSGVDRSNYLGNYGKRRR